MSVPATEYPVGKPTPEQAQEAVDSLNVAAEQAAEAMTEAAYHWLIAHRVTEPGFYGEGPVWDMIEKFYPGGEVAFRRDPLGATYPSVVPMVTAA